MNGCCYEATIGSNGMKHEYMGALTHIIMEIKKVNPNIKIIIGNYFAQLNGQLDALVWTAGVGENDEIVRKEVLKGLTGLGFKLNEAENDKRPGEYALISAEDSKFKIFVIRTNEELEIANETLALI